MATGKELEAYQTLDECLAARHGRRSPSAPRLDPREEIVELAIAEVRHEQVVPAPGDGGVRQVPHPRFAHGLPD
jgi:hypothetical protein